MYRAAGLATVPPFDTADHADQPPVAESLVLVSIRIVVPAGTDAVHDAAPHALDVTPSNTADT
jgi:hypothetical protein